MKEEGKIKHLGVSVEKVEQGIKAMQYSNVTTIQVIYNMFRQRPSELMFELARKNNVGIIVRVPLASGMLSGKYDLTTKFESGDHRAFNREGAAFDKGETFSGVNYELGLTAASELKAYFGEKDLAQVAIQWTLNEAAVSCVIPGASRPEQADHNLGSGKLGQLTKEDMDFVKSVYDKYIKAEVHERW